MTMEVSVLDAIKQQLVPVSGKQKDKGKKKDKPLDPNCKLFDSMVDLGFSVAESDFSRASQIAYLLAILPKLDDAPKATYEKSRDEFKKGYINRYAVKQESALYALDKKGVYQVVTDKTVVDGPETYRVKTLEAVNMAKEDYTLLKTSNPAKRAVVEAIRARVQDYAAVRWMRLISEAKGVTIETLASGEMVINRDGKGRKNPNKRLTDSLREYMAALPKKAKLAQHKGQINLAVLDGAIASFLELVIQK